MNNIPLLDSSMTTTTTTSTTATATASPQEWVRIIGGKHKGKTLRFVKRTEHKVCVERDLDQKKIYLNPEHVHLLNGSVGVTTTAPAPAPTTTTTSSTSSSSSNGPPVHSIPNPPSAILRHAVSPVAAADEALTTPTKWVRITGGKHKGKMVRYIKHTAQRIAVQLDHGKLIYLLPEHVADIMNNGSSGVFPTTTTSLQPPMRPAVTLGAVVSPDARPVTPDAEATLNNSAHDIAEENTTEEEDFATAIMDQESYDFVSAVVEDLASYDRHEQRSDTTTAAAASSSNFRDVATLNTLSSGDRFCIQSGIHAGRMAIFVKNTAQRVAIQLEGEESKIRYLSPSNCFSVAAGSSCLSRPQDKNDPMIRSISQHLPQAVRVINVTASKVQQTLFGVIFGHDDDANVVFFDMGNTASLTKLPESFAVPVHDSNSNNSQTLRYYYLAAVKLHDKAKSLTCAYLGATSNEQVASSLLSIGAFDKLIPRKVAARLELLLSTSATADHIHLLDNATNNFAVVPEKGNVGCGFIPRGMIDQLLGTHSPEVCALQVRIVIPSMGIFKGMLMEKPNISRIELPPSMKKVDAAASSNSNTTGGEAWIMMNQTGIYPYTSRMEQHASSFQDAKEIPEMARWMLTQKGVSQTYMQQPNRKHSNLVGVADPTDSIPPGCVFISGILPNHHHHQQQLRDSNDEFNENVLISRFPMTEASDGRLVPILRKKPPSMSNDDWEFLCSKPFGLVIFGNPAPGERSMPEQIAQGDLDGDGYFVCWDPCILQDAVIGDQPLFAAKNPPVGAPPSNNWWTATQDYMTNMEARKQSQRIIGRLHDGWLRKLRSNLQQDAVAYGRAYKEALVTAKHGGKVNLPSRLWSEIPRDLHGYLK